jgi:hypothetical protein
MKKPHINGIITKEIKIAMERGKERAYLNYIGSKYGLGYVVVSKIIADIERQNNGTVRADV